MDCDQCPDHRAHSILLKLHEKRHDSTDDEFKDVKDALKEKISRWVFIVMITLFSSVQAYQANTLSKVSETLSSIDKKVAILYVSEKLRSEITYKNNDPKVKSCLTLAANLHP